MLLCALPAQAADRDNTDVVVLKNGDRVTGEIEQLEYGLVRLSTDDMGTINIEWGAIASIDSKYVFDVQVVGGLRHSGLIGTSDDGSELVIRDEGSGRSVAVADVVRIGLEPGFWQRLSGSMSKFELHESTASAPAHQHQLRVQGDEISHTRHQRRRDVEPRHGEERAREHHLDRAIPTRAPVFRDVVEHARAQRRARHRRASHDRRRPRALLRPGRG
jgi:hypothetical protein